MSRLLLYTDLSPSRPWLFATIHNNRELLAQNNIVLAPFSPVAVDEPMGHYPYWAERKETDILTPWLKSALLQIEKTLAAGKDVLLFGMSRSVKEHQTFYRLALPLLKNGIHECHSFFICGKPACLLEQRWQTLSKNVTFASMVEIIRQHTAIAQLVSHNQRLWGSENISLLADLSGNAHATPQPELAKALFSWLHCPEPALPQHTIEHPFLFASWPARRLFAARKIRHNVWPWMDTVAYLDTLHKIEDGWPRCLTTPLMYRRMLIDEGEQDLRELETLCHAPEGSLACPGWLEKEQEQPRNVELKPEYAKAFVQALPESVCDALAQRLANDAPLLSSAQKILASVLQEIQGDHNHIGEPVPPPTLTVLTMTYNHEKFIADCMDSVLAQKTDFPVRHIVLDHCSTDATPQIIADYAARHKNISPVLLDHHVANESVRGLFMRCRSTYAAICDGDDYFTDPLKLQKQVDYLEKNPDCALSAHPVLVVFENREQKEFIFPPMKRLPKGPNAKYDIFHLLRGNSIQTNSVVYRWRFVGGLPKWFQANICPGDWYWHLLHAETGMIGYMPEVMSVYRRHKQAIYYTKYTSDEAHRKVHGMAELKTYDALNKHFKGKYFEDFAWHANGVFANFLQHSVKTGDGSLLAQATEKFPEFAGHFLQHLNQ